MKRLISTALAFAMMLALVACGSGAQPTDPQSSSSNISSDNPNSSVDISWQEVGAGPNNSNDTSEMSDTKSTDNRGIPGMSALLIKAVLERSPFGVPITDDVPASEEANKHYAKSCTSSGPDSGNILYDYSITMDNDGEVIGASLGVTSLTADASEVLSAANLFFYAISLIPYDTYDEETLTAWFAENLYTANTNGTSITIGDAVYTLYGNPGLLYFVDISKTV